MNDFTNLTIEEIRNLAGNPNTPTNTLTQLHNQLAGDGQTLINISLNPNTAKEILNQLANTTNWVIKFAIVHNPNTPEHILKQLTKDTNQDVKNAAQKQKTERLTNYINTLTDKEKTQAQLLAATFTGMENDLAELLKNLNTKTVHNNENTF